MDVTELVIVRDEAFTPEEYAMWRAHNDRYNARRRERYATDPEYRARCLARTVRWFREHREHRNAYAREWMRRYRARRRAAA